MPRVRSSFLWIALALALPAAANDNAPEIVMSERVALHDPGMAIHGICRTDHHVYACTDWVTERFEARCERFEEGWGLTVRARLDMVVHLSDPHLIAHERHHINDVSDGLPAKLASLLATRFSEKERCDVIARMMSSADFTRSLMNELRAESNAKRGCTRRALAKPKIASVTHR